MTNCYICKKELGSSIDQYGLSFLKNTLQQEKLKTQTGMSENDVICYDCAKRAERRLGENIDMNLADIKVKPTPLLWLIPVFMGLLGGILMYIAVKDEDQRKANNAILVGLLSTIGLIFLYAFFFAALIAITPMLHF